MSDEARRRQRFDALFEAHRLDIASYCNWRTSSRADAEDAVAEVFLVAWRKIDLSHRATRSGVVVRHRPPVTANTRRSLHRRNALEDRISQERFVDGLESDVLPAEENVVHEALAMLSERDREVLLLVEWEGLRPCELAEVLECQEVTARGRLHRARLRFREAFEAIELTQITARKAQS